MGAATDRLRVLLVDDDSALLEALSDALSLRFDSITVDTCESAAAALERLISTDYDSIISDIKMPGIDGLDLLSRVQELAPDIPTLLITGHGETDLAIRALRAGAFDLIQKPLDREYLVAALKRAAETRCLRRELKAKQEALQAYAEELEARVDARTQELQQALRAKDEFLGLVSHELRTPVTVIFGNADMLHRLDKHLDEDDRLTAIADLRQETRRLLRIIENLLVLARVEYGMKTVTEPVLLSKLIGSQVEWHRQFYRERQIDVPVSPDLPAVDCDATQTELILNNLLTNAEKYSRPDAPIEITAEVEDGEVIVSVLDRGTGIKPEETDLIFKPFYRSNASAQVQGMGIGLAVCKRLIEVQGGRIWASPREDGGSAFSFSLPIVGEQHAAAAENGRGMSSKTKSEAGKASGGRRTART